MTMGVFPSWPRLDPEDIVAAQRVLESSHLSQLSSSVVREFEEAFAEYHGTKYCIAVSSGTAAIHVALAALDVGRGDQVVVPSHTFIGSASPILYQGAEPVFGDVDDKSYCLSSESLRSLLTPRTKVIIAVHLNGHSAPLNAIRADAGTRGIEVIEDVAQGLGGSYMGGKLGTFGRVACFSFWEDKVITMGGEGGAILTNEEELAARLRRLRHHGEDVSPQTRLYSSHELGYNYRLTAMQAAIGRSQLKRLDEYIAIRRRNAARLSDGLLGITGLQIASEAPGCVHAYWKYVCRLRVETVRVSVGEVISALHELGVPAFRRYPIPLHRQPVFASSGHGDQRCPTSDRLAEELFSLPVHPALTNDHIDRMIAAVRDVVEAHVA